MALCKACEKNEMKENQITCDECHHKCISCICQIHNIFGPVRNGKRRQFTNRVFVPGCPIHGGFN